MERLNMAVLLHNIRSAHNVGSIFRTGDAAGVSKLYLTGYSPGPIDQYNRPQKDIAKTALGAELSVPWEQCADPLELISKLKNEGYRIVGVELDPRAIDYREYKPRGNVVFILGNEVTGIPEEILYECDDVVQIPMRGMKESLNVSVAAGVVLFQYATN